MQLNQTTDYALRALLCLAAEQRPLVAAEISEKIKIPPSYVPVIMSKLKKGQFVSSNRGQAGGYCLARRPDEIRLWDVIQVMERIPQLVRCSATVRDCAFDAARCPIRRAYAAAQENLETVWKRTTIADLCQDGDVRWGSPSSGRETELG
jgi:Rrf2 family protein